MSKPDVLICRHAGVVSQAECPWCEITSLRAEVERLTQCKDGMTDREKLIRGGFCFDSDRDADAARYLIGVIDVVRGDRDRLWAMRDEVATLTEENAELVRALEEITVENRLVCEASHDTGRGNSDQDFQRADPHQWGMVKRAEKALARHKERVKI